MEQTTAAPSNFSDADDSILEPYVAPVLYSLVILIGFIGNGLLILTVVAHSAMRSISNIFLLSLAIGDMLVIVIVTPLRMTLYILNSTWKCGEFFCRIYGFLIDLSQGVSIFTLTALAGDRFVAIVLPMTALGWSTKKKTIIINVLLWILAIIFALPGIVTSRLKTFPIMIEGTIHNITYCSLYGIFNTTDIDYHPYVLSSRILNLIVYYIVPLLIITFMYVSIAVTLTRSSSRSAREVLSSSANVNLKKQMMARRHIAKMVLVIVVLFFICWTPHHVIIYFKYFSRGLSYENLRIYFFIHWLFPLLNSCVNPPALYFMNTEFRRYFNHYLFGWCCRSKRLQPKHRSSDGAITATTLCKGANENLNLSKDNVFIN